MANLDLPQLLALAATLGLASGLRLYAVVFFTGLAGHLGWVSLPSGLQVLQSPLLLWGSAGLMAIEFVADKIPWVDSAWDALHTFIRIPAGAALAYGVFGGGDQQAWALLAALAGGTLAAGAHAGKASTRAAVNHSPEPFSNWTLSLLGDFTVPGLLWLLPTQLMPPPRATGKALCCRGLQPLCPWLENLAQVRRPPAPLITSGKQQAC
jgi:hypothetical protein